MATVNGTITVAWGELAIEVDGSDAKNGVVTCDWGGLSIDADNTPKTREATVICRWGE